MSSGAIFAQMGACETRIAETKIEIARLKGKIEDQDSARRTFACKTDDWRAETEDKTEKYNRATHHQDKAVLSFRFQTAVLDKFSWDKPNMAEFVARIDEGMKKETAQQVELLEMKETNMNNLHIQQNNLHIEYQAALAREEAERQANANKNSGKK